MLFLFLLCCSLLQSRGEIERERDALMTEVESSRTKIEVLQRAVDDMTTRIADKVVTLSILHVYYTFYRVIQLFIYLFCFCMSVLVFVCLSVCLSVCLFVVGLAGWLAGCLAV